MRHHIEIDCMQAIFLRKGEGWVVWRKGSVNERTVVGTKSREKNSTTENK